MLAPPSSIPSSTAAVRIFSALVIRAWFSALAAIAGSTVVRAVTASRVNPTVNGLSFGNPALVHSARKRWSASRRASSFHGSLLLFHAPVATRAETHVAVLDLDGSPGVGLSWRW